MNWARTLTALLCLLGAIDSACAKDRVRPPATAGEFYPADPTELNVMIERFLSAAQARPFGAVRAVLVPHAGLVFSGQVAADAFRQVAPNFKRVFIVAANHSADARYEGVSTDSSTHFQVPGARVPVDRLSAKLAKDPFYREVPVANGMHMIEIELPFLLNIAPAQMHWSIVPLTVGRLTLDEVGRFASDLAKHSAKDVLYVFSVDLSHYYPYDIAVQKDRFCLGALRDLDEERTAQCDTDGTQVLLSLVRLAKMRDWEPHLVEYRNSGDVSGDKSRVVGYGAMVFTQSTRLNESDRGILLKIARRSVEEVVKNGQPFEPKVGGGHGPIKSVRGAFVTLEKEGRLRGCIGTLLPSKPLYLDVRDNAIAAATQDRRFPPVQPSEVSELEMSISVLQLPEPLILLSGAEAPQFLVPNRDGLILAYGGRQSTFLPTVWKQIPAPQEFLSQLCLKQGSPPACWQDDRARFLTYRAIDFGE